MSLRAVPLVMVLLAGEARCELATALVGSTVEEVRFESPGPIDDGDLRRHCPLIAGDALTEDRLDQAVRWLERKETFRAVSAVTEMRDGRSVVTFRLEPMPFVVGVNVSGAKALDTETLLRTARIREDEPLSPERIASAEQRLVKLYRTRGYPAAMVAVVSAEEAPGRVLVTIQVDEGLPLRVRSLIVRGIESIAADGVQPTLPFGHDDVVTENALGAGRKALQRFARERGFYESEVDASREDSPDGSVELRYDVLLGPRFEIEIDGARALSRKELLGLIDLTARPIITSGTWKVMAARMRERYQEEGFGFAEVGVSITGGTPKRVRFTVDEGPAVRVRNVRFVGNTSMSSGTLAKQMSIASWSSSVLPRWWLGWTTRGADRFRESVLAEDLERIAETYRHAGYLNVETREGRREYSAERTQVALTIEISEGERSVVESVEISGAEGILARPDRGLQLRNGAPVQPDALEKDRQTLLRRLAGQGFLDATVTSAVSEGVANEMVIPVRVRHRVMPGKEVRVGEVIIQGNYFTRDSVVRDTLPFARGDVLDPERLATGQANLYRLGIFRGVSVQPEATAGESRDVAVRVAERPAGELQYGIGYDTRAGVHSFLQIGHRNIAGSGDQLTLRGDLNLSPSDFVADEYIVSLEGKQPYFQSSGYDLKGSVARRQSERSIDEFSIRETSMSGGFEREFIRGLRGSLLLEFQDSDIFDVQTDAVLTGQDVGKLRTVSLNPILVYDGRDDPFAPTRGVFDSVRLRYATPRLESEVEFFKMVAQHSQYVPLTKTVTLIYGLRIGWAKVLGASNAIPLRDRLFLGGRTSVRGFEENEIGPRGSGGNPIGGDFLVNLQTEIRFPLVLGVGGAVFADGGGLYLQDRGISVADFRESVGPGLRYQTPVGSISLDFGFKIQPRSDESIGEIHFTIGNIF